jgi:hypothetical protein
MNILIQPNSSWAPLVFKLLPLPSQIYIHEQNTTSYLTLLLHAVSPCDTEKARFENRADQEGESRTI